MLVYFHVILHDSVASFVTDGPMMKKVYKFFLGSGSQRFTEHI